MKVAHLLKLIPVLNLILSTCALILTLILISHVVIHGLKGFIRKPIG